MVSIPLETHQAKKVPGVSFIIPSPLFNQRKAEELRANALCLRAFVEGYSEQVDRVQHPVDHPRPAGVETDERRRQLKQVPGEVIDVELLIQRRPTKHRKGVASVKDYFGRGEACGRERGYERGAIKGELLPVSVDEVGEEALGLGLGVGRLCMNSVCGCGCEVAVEQSHSCCLLL